MRSIAALLLLSLVAGRAEAEEVTFFEKSTDKFWSVTGAQKTDTGQATCYAWARKKDGSFVQIHRSLVDGELWILIRDNSWQMSGDDKGTLRWNFYSGRESVISGGDFRFQVQSKNTIVIPDVAAKQFTAAMWNARYFTLVMPGDVPNTSIGFESKGAATLVAMADCIKRNEKRFKGKAPKDNEIKPLLKTIPDDVKGQI
jgi:hypothetical protein